MTAFCYPKDGELVEVGEVDWRALPDEPDPDDEEMDETPDDVVLMLGFDPKDDIEKAVRKPDMYRRAMDELEARHKDERLRVGAALAREISREVKAATSMDDLMRRLKVRKETRDVAELADSIAAAAFDAVAEGTRRGKG